MKAILGLAVVCILVAFSDAQITAWTQTGFTVSAGTGTSMVTMTYDTKVLETSTASAPIVTLAATPTGGSATINYAFTAAGNPDSVGAIGLTTGAITLATGKSIDYETTTSIVFVVTATEQSVATGNVIGTATVTVEIMNMVEYSQDQYGVCVADGATAGTTIGTYTVADAQSGDTIVYSLSGATDLTYSATTGVLSVSTGITLSQSTTGGYALTLTATPAVGSTSSTTPGTSAVWVAVATCSSGVVQVTAMLGMVLLSIAAALLV